MYISRATLFSQGQVPETRARTAITAPTPPRQQPEGLRARFFPIGVNDPSQKPGSRVAEPSPTREEVEVALAAASSTSDIKAIAAAQIVETPRSKKPKKRKHESVAEDGPRSKEVAEAESSTKRAKKAKILDAAPIAPPSLPVNSSSSTKITPILPPASQKKKETTKSTPMASSQSTKRSTVPLPGYIRTAAPAMSSGTIPVSTPTSSLSAPSQETPSRAIKKLKRNKEKGKEKAGSSQTPETANNRSTGRRETPIPVPLPRR